MGERAGASIRLAAWCAALVVLGRLLLAAGGGDLSVPLTSLEALVAWAERVPAPDMAIAVLRLAGLAACAHLLAVTALGVAARALRLRALTRAADRVTPRMVRRLVTGGSGVGLALGAVVGVLPASYLAPASPGATVAAAHGSDPGAPAQATMTRVTSADRAVPAATDAPVVPGGTASTAATMTRVEPPASATMRRTEGATTVPVAMAAPPTPGATPPAGVSGTGLPAAPDLPDVDAATWVVQPGDSLWSIAAEVVQGDAGRAVEQAVSAYWRSLVAANRSGLVDPDNPDLLVPGQHLVLPPHPS